MTLNINCNRTVFHHPEHPQRENIKLERRKIIKKIACEAFLSFPVFQNTTASETYIKFNDDDEM